MSISLVGILYLWFLNIYNFYIFCLFTSLSKDTNFEYHSYLQSNCKINIQIPQEPHEHHLGEDQQGMAKRYYMDLISSFTDKILWFMVDDEYQNTKWR